MVVVVVVVEEEMGEKEEVVAGWLEAAQRFLVPWWSGSRPNRKRHI